MNVVEPRPLLSSVNIHASIRALVVDDDVFQQDLMVEILKSLGLRDITAVSSGELALRVLTDSPQPFDLMLLDVFMPGMDGFQFMESVSEVGFSGGMVIVSGQSREVLDSAALMAQLWRYKFLGSIEKPVDRAGLAAIIANRILPH
jgi:CheY-like chemotaxis protein